MTTKKEEREALQQINFILAQLEPDSYVCTAFAGCADIAEQNIENDWACSYRQQVESLTAEKEALQATVRDQNQRINGLMLQLQQADESRVSGQDLSKAVYHLTEERKHIEKLRDTAAAEIVRTAGNPTGEDFQQAVNTHRNAEAAIADLVNLADRLRKGIR